MQKTKEPVPSVLQHCVYKTAVSCEIHFVKLHSMQPARGMPKPWCLVKLPSEGGKTYAVSIPLCCAVTYIGTTVQSTYCIRQCSQGLTLPSPRVFDADCFTASAALALS